MNSQSHATPSNLVPTQEATSWNMPMPSTQQVVPPASVVAPDAMEVGPCEERMGICRRVYA